MKKLLALLLVALTAVSAAAKTPVLFLHGWSGDSGIWTDLRRLLKAHGGYMDSELRATDYWIDDNTPIEDYAGNIAATIIQYCKDRRVSQVDVVAHSMGGLVVREILRAHPEASGKIRRVVTLGTPHYGQNQSWGNSAEQMTYGSHFLFKLARAWENGEGVKLPSNRFLCVIGDRGDGSDGLVNCWSAALNGAGQVYVKKKHSTAIKHAVYWADAIYECADRNDPVYRAVASFLGTGSLSSAGTSGFLSAPARGGGIFFQVVDQEGNPVRYGGSFRQDFIRSVLPAPSGNFKEHHGDWGWDLDNTSNANLQGIGLVTSARGNTYDGLPAGAYRLSFKESDDGTIPAFTSPSIKVEDNRTTIARIVVRPGADVCFLIDSTGSMGPSIASVKATAASMVRDFCLGADGTPSGNRVAVMEYRDSGDSFVTRTLATFTTNAAVAVAAIDGISVDGGGDTPEALYCAISRAVGGSAGAWRTGAARHIVVMTDAPPHDPDPVTGDTQETIRALLAAGTGGASSGSVRLHSVCLSGDSSVSAAYRTLSAASGGTCQSGVSATQAAEAIRYALAVAALSDVDLRFAKARALSSWPGPAYLSASSAETGAPRRTAFLVGEKIYPHVCFSNGGGEDMPSIPFTIRHRLLGPAGDVLATWNYTESNAIKANYCRWWHKYAFPILQGLPAGEYVYSCELDTGDAVPETDEGNNSISTAFFVVKSFNGIPYTVQFKANGGSGSMSPQTMVYGTQSALSPLGFSRPGWVFLGWARTPGGNVAFGNRKAVKNLSPGGEPVVLYAKWAKKTYKVAYRGNGGKLPKGSKMSAQSLGWGTSAKLKANRFKRTGWVFLGWATSKNGAVRYGNKAAVKNLRSDGSTVTLYARWAKRKYKVRFLANGGSGTMAVQKMTYGKAKKLSANKFVRDGYTFKGWAKSKALAKKGKVAFKNKKAVKNLVKTGKTVKLYAVWRKR